ncbi:MAG: UDP-N-acetylglucosamine--N-acetylmuramyl-(pentapeptide) pyrophosphoryl-undecaprenol N-acetylglucosamine transferase [Brevinemataceae bacterium]
MRIVIGGGGTAGHLIPGISLFKELKKHNCEIRFVMREKDLEYGVVSQLPSDDIVAVSLSNVSRKLSFRTFKQVFSILSVCFQTFKTLSRFNPDIIVITGGYVSNTAAFAAFLMRKPLFILEQNSAAGITNRIWARIAKKVFTAFPSTKNIPQEKICYTGNPLLFNKILDRDEAVKILGLTGNTDKIIGITGGSQGAKLINDTMFDILPELVAQGFCIVWSLGTREFSRFEKTGKIDTINNSKLKNHVQLFKFIDRMDAFWSCADIVIARSGAGTVTESLFFKTPALFIPIYQSPDNHQYLNALFLAQHQCAQIIEEPLFNKKTLLDSISQMMNSCQELKSNFPAQINNTPEQLIAEYLINY